MYTILNGLRSGMYTILNGLRSGMYTILNGERPGRAGRCSKEVALPAMRSKGAGGGEPAKRRGARVWWNRPQPGVPSAVNHRDHVRRWIGSKRSLGTSFVQTFVQMVCGDLCKSGLVRSSRLPLSRKLGFVRCRQPRDTRCSTTVWMTTAAQSDRRFDRAGRGRASTTARLRASSSDKSRRSCLAFSKKTW